MKILLAPDSFKGSLTSTEICEILERELSRRLPDAEIVSLPLADGGEGTLDAFNGANPGQIVYAKATDPWFNEIDAPYLLYNANTSGICTAVIESARVCGFIPPVKSTAFLTASHSQVQQVSDNESALNPMCTTAVLYSQTQQAPDGRPAPNPMLTTTYGLGLLIRDALKRGARKILIGLGGSCTNDGGCGMAAALGTVFYGIHANDHFIPTGGTLAEIAYMDNTETISLLGGTRSLFEGKTVDIVGMCDVTNPLCGKYGAAHVFAPQKGASEEDVIVLDEGLEHLVSSIDNAEAVSAGGILFPGVLSAKKLASLPGSGAAGGLGFGIRAFAGGRLEKGIDLILDTLDFNRHLTGADLVITGEGHFDSQTLNGKVVSGVCKRTAAANIPTIILCGKAEESTKISMAQNNSDIIETGFIDFANLTDNEIRKQAIDNMIKAINSAKILTG